MMIVYSWSVAARLARDHTSPTDFPRVAALPTGTLAMLPTPTLDVTKSLPISLITDT